MDDEKARQLYTDGWRCTGPYEYVHPAGWTIANRIIRAKSVWLLRQAGAERGSFRSADDAMRRHAELSGYSAEATPSPSIGRRGTGRSARRWQVKVCEAEAELVHRIGLIEAGSDATGDSKREATLTRLRQRLSRIIYRYCSILG